ncbi:MAG: hypothetical protein PVF22_04545 [Candidatus Aminicenantes bacterium]
MKRLSKYVLLLLAFILCLGTSVIYPQATFKISFKFYVEAKSYPPGDYWVAQKEEGKITLRRETGDEEVVIPFIERLAQPDPPIKQPQLIFDMVGNFEPSYTEYITDYLLAEVWLTGEDGYLVLATERSEYRKCVKGVEAKK